MTHPKCPARLARLYRKLGTLTAVSRDRGVNIRYVYDAIILGVPPSVKNTQARTRLYFPKTNRKPAAPATAPDWLNWWRHLSKDQRKEVIQSAYKKEFHK